MTRTVLALLAIPMISGCFLSPSWRESHRAHERQRIELQRAKQAEALERKLAKAAEAAELARLRHDAEVARLRYCVEHPEDCVQDRAIAAEDQRARDVAARERRAMRVRAISGALIEASRPPPAPPPQRPVSCETRTIGATAYTDCR